MHQHRYVSKQRQQCPASNLEGPALNPCVLVKSRQQLPTDLMGIGWLSYMAKWVWQAAGRAARLLRTNIF